MTQGGESRAYRIRDGVIAQLTRGRSLVNDYLLVMPDMTEEQKDELPKNVITRALGMQDSVAVDMVPDEPAPNDLYVLCSDGLSGMITDERIRDIATETQDNLEAGVEQMIAEANANGGEDNITVVTLRFTD